MQPIAVTVSNDLDGLEVSIRQAGIGFANTRYSLWCANHAGRTNPRKGIALKPGVR